MTDKNKQLWWDWHKKNPHVYQLFERFTWQCIAAGRTHYSAMAILQRIRWHSEIETKGDDFKINNNHAPYYARLFAHQNPKYKDFFRTRTV